MTVDQDDGSLDHDRNVIGAAALLIAERVQVAVEAVTGMSGASAAALTALRAWADGSHLDALAGGLRLSHSRTVRVVDRLVADGLARRTADPTDARRVAVELTAGGRRAADLALTARARAVADVLDGLQRADVAALARSAEEVLFQRADSRREARALCRMCDTRACGHREGTCPSTRGADARSRAPGPTLPRTTAR